MARQQVGPVQMRRRVLEIAGELVGLVLVDGELRAPQVPTYGATRGLAAWVIIVLFARKEGWRQGLWLTDRAAAAYKLGAAHLVFLGAAVSVVIGF